MIVSGQMHPRVINEDLYERNLPAARFSKLIHDYEPNSGHNSNVEVVPLGDYGKQLWGIGYVSSEYEADAGHDSDWEADEKEHAANCALAEKMLDKQVLDEDDMERVYDSSRLRDIYKYRWYMAEG